MSNLNSLYARLGGEEGVIRLVKAYIEALKTLPGAQRLRSLYPEDLSKYELRMTEFLSTWLGGPALYQERHGMPMLRESHRSFAIDGEARDEWMLCMRTALRETVSDEELAARRAKWQPRAPRITTGYLARYAALVTSGNTGAILKAPEA